jgi:hypothetical protein
MVEITASDFEVTVVAQKEENYFLADKKNVFFHFVFFHKKGYYNEVNQFYIHRFELADWLNKVINKKVENDINVASGLVNLSFQTNGEEQILSIQYDEIAFEVNLVENDFCKQLLSDVSILEKIDIESIKKAFKKKIISAVVDEYDVNKNYTLSDTTLRAAAFELKSSKTKKTWQRTSYFYDLLKMELQDTVEMNKYLASELMMGLDIVVGKTECNCINDGCFFDILNTAYTTFFNEEDLLTVGKLDEAKAEFELAKIWKELTPKQRVVLNFLDDRFGNTPLINLYLLAPNVNVQEYIYKMTYPYQPDSEDDLFVRKIASWVGFYMK